MKLFETNKNSVRIKKDWVFIHLVAPWYVNGKIDRVKYFELMSLDIKEIKESYYEV
jgi:hypothetical protein